MTLIIGGAYQGKLDYAKEVFGITDGDVHICDAGNIDFSKRCIYKIEEFTYNHPDPIGYFEAHVHQPVRRPKEAEIPHGSIDRYALYLSWCRFPALREIWLCATWRIGWVWLCSAPGL